MIGAVELIVAAFDDEDKANQILKHLQNLQKDKVIDIINAAVMVKTGAGRTIIKETQDVNSSQGAIFGAIVGGVIGLIGGPAGVIAGAAAGAAAGGVTAHQVDMGFDDDMLAELKDGLPPGSSAIITMVEYQWVESTIRELDQAGAKIVRQALKDEIAVQIVKAREG